MGEFEKWFINQDFYTNMRFIHGDNLFSKDGDVYRVLPVQMTFVAFSEKHAEYAEARQVGIALNTETINQRRYIGSQQAKIEQLEKEKQALHNAFVYMDECRKEWHEGYMRLHKQKTEITRLVQGLRNEFNLWSDDGEGSDAIEAQIELLEKALRGAND